jgi:hypothetical protein
MDTFQANLALHYPADRRNYDVPCAILRRLKVGTISLLTNNPVKAEELKDFMPGGVEQVIPLKLPPCAHNQRCESVSRGLRCASASACRSVGSLRTSRLPPHIHIYIHTSTLYIHTYIHTSSPPLHYLLR